MDLTDLAVIALKQGTNPPVDFVFPAGTDFGTTAGKTFTLIIAWGTSRLTVTAANGLSIIDAQTVRWSPTLSDIWALPLGSLARAELRWTSGGSVVNADTFMVSVAPGYSPSP